MQFQNNEIIWSISGIAASGGVLFLIGKKSTQKKPTQGRR
jgi:hypothetical protein